MTSLGVQIGVVMCVAGAFFAALAVLSATTLRLSGTRGLPPLRQLSSSMRDNPFETSLAFMAHLLKPAIAFLSLGAVIALASGLIAGL